MYLFRFLADECYKVGVRVGDVIIDLQVALADIPDDIAHILNQWERYKPLIEKAVTEASPDALLQAEHIKYAVPIPKPNKILCVGLNYAAHAMESTYKKPPEFPVLFIRFPSTLVAHKGNIIKPSCSDKLDYEGELAFVINQDAYQVEKEHALDYVGGYTVFNDASVRDYQKRTSQWTMGKNFDATGGIGSEIAVADCVPEGATGLQIQTKVNGVIKQDGNTDDMIFDVPTLVSHITEVMTLNAGDIIVTGTPEGVGFAQKPPLYLKEGDECSITIEKIGTLVNYVTSS